MSTSLPNLDYSIDLTINEIVAVGNRRIESGVKVDVQAKSAVGARVEGTHVRYDLEARAYEALRQPAPRVPRILVVLLLPAHESLWTTQTEDELVLRSCAYWLSLKGQGPTSNRRSVRVLIPRANLFSVEALQAIMGRISAGEAI